MKDAVEAVLDDMKAIKTHQTFMQTVWADDLFCKCTDEDEVYKYIQDALECIHEDKRHHHDVAQDESFSIGSVVPRPLSVAANQIALRHGFHCETFLLAMASNVTWQEHSWTRLGAEPPPQGVNVVEENVGSAAYAAGARANFVPLSEQTPSQQSPRLMRS